MKWVLITEEWPTFLYDEQAGWSNHNIRNGLFWGHVLARVCSTHSAIANAWLTNPVALPGCDLPLLQQICSTGRCSWWVLQSSHKG